MTTHSLVENDCRDLGFIPDESVKPGHHTSAAASLVGSRSASRPVLGDCGIRRIPDGARRRVGGVRSRACARRSHLACIASPVARKSETCRSPLDIHASPPARPGDRSRRSVGCPRDRVELARLGFLRRAEPALWERFIATHRTSWSCESRAERTRLHRDTGCLTPGRGLLRHLFFVGVADSRGARPATSEELPHRACERLIRMFSFAGDTVLDPFAGIGTTSAAARACGRNSIAVEIEQRYFDSMADRMSSAEWPEGEIKITGAGWPPGGTPVAMPAV